MPEPCSLVDGFADSYFAGGAKAKERGSLRTARGQFPELQRVIVRRGERAAVRARKDAEPPAFSDDACQRAQFPFKHAAPFGLPHNQLNEPPTNLLS